MLLFLAVVTIFSNDLILDFILSTHESSAYFFWVNSYSLGAVVCFVDTYQPVGQFKHVIAQTDDDKLRILRALLGVAVREGYVDSRRRKRRIGGMKGGREGGREGEREGGREGGREGEREGGREGGREEEDEHIHRSIIKNIHHNTHYTHPHTKNIPSHLTSHYAYPILHSFF